MENLIVALIQSYQMNSLIVKYINTGNLYKVVDDNAVMKHPITRKWEPAVVYKSYKLLEPTGEYRELGDSDSDEVKKTFIRLKSEFLQKFETVLDL